MNLDSRIKDEGRGKPAKLRGGGETELQLPTRAMEALRAKSGNKLAKLMAIAPTLTLTLAALMGTATATQAASRERLNVFDQQEAQTEQPLTQSLDNSVSGLYAHSMASGTVLTSWVDGENHSVDDRSEQILENSQANLCPWWWPPCNGGGNGGPWGSDDDDD